MPNMKHCEFSANGVARLTRIMKSPLDYQLLYHTIERYYFCFLKIYYK